MKTPGGIKTKRCLARKIHLAVLALLCFYSFNTNAQFITHLEYFFDTDPGVGNGTPLIVPVPADTITLNTTINTTGLPGGTHVLFIRAKLANGKWSLYEPQQFHIRSNITQAEYFYDTDPGIGLATALPIALLTEPATHTATLPTTGLQGGTHILFIRTRDNQGKWSLYEPREFHIRSNITQAEYFFDTDPGIGLATPLPIASLTEPASYTSTINTTGLSGGNHVLFIRTKDNAGKWSLYEPREFHIRSRITAAEYFFDTDPGVGLATPLPAAALVEPATYLNTIITPILPSGNHLLFLRTKDEQGKWSLYEPREFHIRTSIVAAEYFIDTDPGVGLATPLPVGPLSDTVTFANTISTPLLPLGAHFLFIRTKDIKGVWSLYEPKQFNVSDNPLPVVWLSFNAERKNSDALLTWTTASEQNCSHFEVERSMSHDANTNNYIKIGEVKGSGTTNQQNQYRFTDYSVQHKGTCYYRIKQVDFNGDYIYSRTVAVDFGSTSPVIKFYPNPSSEFFTLDVAGDCKTILSLVVANSRGQIVAEHNAFSFPFRFGHNLTAGSYVVTITTESQTMQFKVIKAK